MSREKPSEPVTWSEPLETWTARVAEKVRVAGFPVEVRLGMPFVPTPLPPGELVRYFRWEPEGEFVRSRVYREGVLLTPGATACVTGAGLVRVRVRVLMDQQKRRRESVRLA